MDLIEVLWKQDVDLGYNPPLSVSQKEAAAEDDIEKLKALLEMKDDKVMYSLNSFDYLKNNTIIAF